MSDVGPENLNLIYERMHLQPESLNLFYFQQKGFQKNIVTSVRWSGFIVNDGKKESLVYTKEYESQLRGKKRHIVLIDKVISIQISIT